MGEQRSEATDATGRRRCNRCGATWDKRSTEAICGHMCPDEAAPDGEEIASGIAARVAVYVATVQAALRGGRSLAEAQSAGLAILRDRDEAVRALLDGKDWP